MASGEAATSSPSEGRKDGRSVCDANARAARTRARGIAHTPPLPSFVCVVVLYCRTVPCRLVVVLSYQT